MHNILSNPQTWVALSFFILVFYIRKPIKLQFANLTSKWAEKIKDEADLNVKQKQMALEELNKEKIEHENINSYCASLISHGKESCKKDLDIQKAELEDYLSRLIALNEQRHDLHKKAAINQLYHNQLKEIELEVLRQIESNGSKKITKGDIEHAVRS